ncbi:nanos homolog 2-like [Thrips palmi]|uniref:Nanos homolog 2-like n=1 Tax=Thrips palmi TaxID=161013 RepID=A0A6P8Y9P4_THRPL|nr:nanos homolog 2-like [Thrips palmi]
MGSLSAGLSSSSPSSSSPPGASMLDSSDVDALALAMAQLQGSCGGMQPQQQQPGGNSKPRKNGQRKSGMFCAFCRGNGELARTYLSHALHTELPDGTVVVTCEVLRSLKCELCGASGDVAHTRSHCPFNHGPSVAVLLKNTPRRCDGTLRKKNRK